SAPPIPAAPPVPAEQAAVPLAAEPAATTPAQPAAPVAPAQPRFVLVEGGAELPLPMDRTEIVVGREDPISQIFPEIDLTPYGGEGGGVSRQHARLSHSNGQWTIVDLNSTNYTRVDGARLDPNRPTLIADGAQIQFGRIAVVFHA
ncbi:MAG: FHA domain-containing protein, partial [Chloroflexales bacterium]|nr:FHA domain-containing protein [Chloroflexales bacterium]